MNPLAMTPLERRAAFSLAAIFAVRMLGLFLILPIFALYAEDLRGATPSLIGLAIGAYGLTQALLQIPFGMLSDRYGRKPVITLGLIIFIIGSIIAAMSDSITGIIIGRSLQGAGAIGSTIIALIADLTQEERRTKAMAIVGLSIGLSFAAAMVFGPLLNDIIHIPGIFWLTAVMGATSIMILYTIVPTPKRSILHRDAQPVITQLFAILRKTELLRLDIGIFVLHGTLTALFVVIPSALQQLPFPESKQWILYLIVLGAAFVSMLPFIILAEKKRQIKLVFIGAIACLALSQLGMYLWHTAFWGMAFSLYVFFTAFTLLEATLPSLIAKIAPADRKGTAMGVYSCWQFMGIFVGGLVGGWLYGNHASNSIFLAGVGFSLIWLLIAVKMKNPRHLGTHMLNVGPMDTTQARDLSAQLQQVVGVAEVSIIPDDGIAYLKVDNRTINKVELNKFSKLSS